MKKCPPGIICIENITLFLLCIITSILVFFIYANSKQNITIKDQNHITIEQRTEGQGQGQGWITNFFPSWPYNNQPQDVLLNPYAPPLRDERYFIPEVTRIPPNTVPINVSTNIGATPADTAYRQMGILTPLNGASKDNLLPLMGRPLFTSRQKFQYYTISNQHNNIKLPISVKGRSGLDEYGVDEVFDSDTVYVEGYNDAFRVTKYDNNTIRYLPFL
jgi:hypothetical protein